METSVMMWALYLTPMVALWTVIVLSMVSVRCSHLFEIKDYSSVVIVAILSVVPLFNCITILGFIYDLAKKYIKITLPTPKAWKR